MLFLQRQPGEQRQDVSALEPGVDLHPGAEGVGSVANLALAGEEHQDVAGRLQGEFVDGVTDGVERVAVAIALLMTAGAIAALTVYRPIPTASQSA